MKKMMNGIWLGLAFVFIALGLLGIALPILPTTPFFLLAAGLFAKGSGRFHRWFGGTRFYKKYIAGAVLNKEMTKKAKIKVLFMVTCFFAICFGLSPVWYARAVIAAALAGHYYYFLVRIRTIEEKAHTAEEQV